MYSKRITPLYPILNSKKAKKDNSICKISVAKKSFIKKDKSKEQVPSIIDTTRLKEIGVKECKVCKMVYIIGMTEDEKLHRLYHENYHMKHDLRYPGWEKENQIGTYKDGVVIKLFEKHFKLKKLQDILSIVNRDLGISYTDLEESQIVNCLLFISKNGRVKGCLVAESIRSASPMVLHLKTWCVSSESVPALCGINLIWVAEEYRRHKVASRMIDCLMRTFLFGYVIDVKELAFSHPTPNGRDFAAFYTGTDNFLVYQ